MAVSAVVTALNASIVPLLNDIRGIVSKKIVKLVISEESFHRLFRILVGYSGEDIGGAIFWLNLYGLSRVPLVLVLVDSLCGLSPLENFSESGPERMVALNKLVKFDVGLE